MLIEAFHNFQLQFVSPLFDIMGEIYRSLVIDDAICCCVILRMADGSRYYYSRDGWYSSNGNLLNRYTV
jgi:hypothetical protein